MLGKRLEKKIVE